LKKSKNQQRIRIRVISNTFKSNLWEEVFPIINKSRVEKIQVSIMKESSPFNTEPSIIIK